MKKHLLLAFALAMGFGTKAQTYIPISVSGYTADVVAEGSGSASNSTTQDVDGVSYNFVAQNFVNPSNVSPTSALPNNGVINSATTAGLPFQLAPYSGNNSLRISSTGTGTLTFGTPRAADQVYVLATSGSGISTVTITVTFTDATTQVFSAQTINDWFGGTNYAIQGISRVNRTTNVIENNATDPRLYQTLLTISAANVNKPIQSISFNKTSTTGVLNVMGVTIKASIPPSPNDAGVTAINAPGSPTNPGNQNIQVTLKNFGTSALTSAQINWKVGATLGAPFTFSGNLAPGASVSSPITIGSFNFTTGTHTIKTWTSNPNGQTDGNNYNDTLSINVISCNTLSGTFAIDKNSPASATSFPSFAAALQSLTSCGVSGPVIFNVATGTGPYNEQVVLPAIIGASATNTITFNGNGNTLVNPSTSGDALKLNGAKYLRFNNLKIEAASGATAGTVVSLVSAAENNIFTGCTFTHSTTTTSTAQVVYVYSGSSNNTFQNNTIIGAYYGIYNYGASATLNNNNQFIGNTIKDPYYYGIYNYYSPGTLIEGNDISRPTRTNGTSMYGIYNSTGGTGVTISKNRIHNTHDAATSTTGTVYGIYTSVAATVGAENIVKNNLIYNINANGGTLYAFYNSGGNGTYYYHNTVSADNPAISYSTLRGMYFLSASTNVKFVNNILSLSSNGTTKHAIYLASSTISLISNNNDLYIGSTGNVGYYSSAKATLADWQAANTNAYDQNSVAADPQFVNLATGNLQPTSGILNNIGQPTPVTDDITGAVRNTATPDPGAYEFTPSSNDVGVTAITSPVSGCGLTASENIVVTIQNFGTVAQNNIPLSYTINGGTPVTHTFAGPINPGASATVTFPTPANLGTPNTYILVARTNLSSDALPANDATTKTVVAIPSISTLPYSEGFENGNGGWIAGGTSSSWALGTPAKAVINSAATGTKAWVTNLTGQYNASENSQVVGPCFNFAGKPDPDFEMKAWWNSEAGWDGAVLQSSIDGGTTWQNVGAFADPNNWFNDNSLDGRAGGQDQGWAGRVSTSNGSNGWVKVKHKLTGLGGQSSVLLRIAFGSDGSVQDDGFAFDDIRIGDNTNNLAINSFTPLTKLCGFGSNEQVQVQLENLGSVPASGYTVSYTVNDGTTTTAPVTQTGPTLAPGVPTTFTFTTGANLSAAGSYTIVVTVNMTGDPEASNNSITYTISNATFTGLPPVFNFEPSGAGIAQLRIVNSSKSGITENTAASSTLTPGSTKGMIMEGVDDPSWLLPVGLTDPWTNNLNNFSAAYICFNPNSSSGGPLYLNFDLKQLFKTANANTNFRVTVNGVQVGPTYRPPFSGTPIAWQHITVDLSAYTSQTGIQIGLESSVKEAFAAGAGTANLIDNISFTSLSGVKENVLASSLSVYPNPSNGLVNVSLENGKAFELEVTDLTGKTVLKQAVKAKSTQLNLGNAAKGIYFLKITSDNSTATKKLVIE